MLSTLTKKDCLFLSSSSTNKTKFIILYRIILLLFKNMVLFEMRFIKEPKLEADNTFATRCILKVKSLVCFSPRIKKAVPRPTSNVKRLRTSQNFLYFFPSLTCAENFTSIRSFVLSLLNL
jgi:hypothetical protein